MEHNFDSEKQPVTPPRNFRASANMHKTDMPINQFGHTVTNPDTKNVTPLERMKFEIDGSGNHMVSGDIFDSPHLQKFMKQRGLKIAETPVVDTDLEEEIDFDPVPPTDLEAFEALAESLISVPQKLRFTPEYNYELEDRAESPCATSSVAKTRVIISENGCADCKTALNPGVKFCTMCGSKQPTRFCGGCGHKFTDQERFCPNCGLQR